MPRELLVTEESIPSQPPKAQAVIRILLACITIQEDGTEQFEVRLDQSPRYFSSKHLHDKLSRTLIRTKQSWRYLPLLPAGL